MDNDNKSFFRTLPGILTGLTSLVVAVTSLYVALKDAGTTTRESQTVVTEVERNATAAEPDEQHRWKLEKLRREKELAEIRLQQERERLKAEKELQEIRLEAERQKVLVAEQRERARLVEEERKRARERAVPTVSGSWTFTNVMGTYTFVLRQSGNTITLQEFDVMGNLVGNGNGTLNGRSVNLNWVEPYMYVTTIQVQAHLELSQDGRHLVGQLVTQGSSMAVTFFKQ